MEESVKITRVVHKTAYSNIEMVCGLYYGGLKGRFNYRWGNVTCKNCLRLKRKAGRKK